MIKIKDKHLLFPQKEEPEITVIASRDYSEEARIAPGGTTPRLDSRLATPDNYQVIRNAFVELHRRISEAGYVVMDFDFQMTRQRSPGSFGEIVRITATPRNRYAVQFSDGFPELIPNPHPTFYQEVVLGI